jgi:hypothetical protein
LFLYKRSASISKQKREIDLQKLGHGGGQGNQRGTSVQNDTGVLKFSNVVTEGNRVKVDLPVRLATERNLDQLASVVALVDTTESSFRAITVLVGITQVEGKHGLINRLLVDHVVEGGDHLVNGDGVVAKAKNTIKATESKGKARLIGGLSKVLSLDLQVTDLQSVLGHEAAQAAGSIPNLELGTILLICARSGRVIFAVKEASDGAALLGRNPQVGATGVENNLEGLGRSADLNLGEVWLSQHNYL